MIVEYTDNKEPKNQYPERIISPLRSGPCCVSDMEEIGVPQEDGSCVFRYKRCRRCGFAVRVIVRVVPDPVVVADLRRMLAKSFERGF